MIHVEVEAVRSVPFSWTETGRQVLTGALAVIGCPYEADINVLITDAASVQEINENFRQIDQTTDVLSFPVNEFRVPEVFEEEFLDFHPGTGALLLGDIVINAECVFSQAAAYGHTPLREYAFLLVHSLLHLVGHDHMATDEEERMRSRQRVILEALEIER